MSQVIIITGMHRSGTSLVASFLQKAGLHIGQKLLVPGKENPRGFFEDVDFFEFHEAALHAQQKTYLVDKAFSFTPTQQELETARALLKKRQGQPVWGWKDPRTALFLPFWDTLLPEAHYLFVFRHPLEVLLSLVRSQHVYNIGLVEGLAAWLVYNKVIASFYEANPERCALCHIHSLLTNFDSFERVLDKKLELQVNTPRSLLDTLYHETELHQLPITGEIQHLLSQLFADIITLYDQLNTIADLPAPTETAPAETVPVANGDSELLLLSQVATKWVSESGYPTGVKRGLMQLLLTAIEPEMTEAFYRHHLDHLFETVQAKDKFWDELQSLGKDWEAQRQYIEGQQKHIQKQQDHISKQQDYIDGQQAYVQSLKADKAALQNRINQLQARLDGMPTEQEILNRLSSYDISHRIPIKKIVEAIGYKMGHKIGGSQPAWPVPAVDNSNEPAAPVAVSHELTHHSAATDKPTILLVYPELGNPTRYRVFNQIAQMEMVGYRPILRAINELVDSAGSVLSQVDLLYLYRLESIQPVHQLIDAAQQQKVPVVFDTDDLIWDQKLESYCFLKEHLSAEEIVSVLAAIRRHEIIMEEVDYFVASTDYLAQLLKNRFGKRVFVNKNALSEEAQVLSDPLFQVRRERGPVALSSPVTIVYGSGWPRAHQEDFGIAAEPLRQLIIDRPQVRVKIIGHLDTTGMFPGYENRLEHQTFIKWNRLPEALSSAEINLAPIVNNPHRRSKSGIKFSAAALVGLPTVASNLEPYQDIRHGQTGYLATTPEEWYDCLAKLVDSPERRWTMGIAAREQVMEEDTVQVRAEQYKLVLEQILEDYRGQQ